MYYSVVLLLNTFILISQKTSVYGSFTESDIVDEIEYQHCICVPFWQCKEDYSGLIEDGIDVMDIR